MKDSFDIRKIYAIVDAMRSDAQRLGANVSAPWYREHYSQIVLNLLNATDKHAALCKDKAHPFYISKVTGKPVRLHFNCNKWSCLGCAAMKIAEYINFLCNHFCLNDTVYRIEVVAKLNKTVREKLSRLYMPRFTFSLIDGGLLVILKSPVVFSRLAHEVESIPMEVDEVMRYLITFDHSRIDRGFANRLFVTKNGKRAKNNREGWYLPREIEDLSDAKEAKSHYIPNTSKDFVEYLANYGILIDQPLPNGMSDDDLTKIIKSYVPARDFKLTDARLGRV